MNYKLTPSKITLPQQQHKSFVAIDRSYTRTELLVCSFVFFTFEIAFSKPCHVDSDDNKQ